MKVHYHPNDKRSWERGLSSAVVFTFHQGIFASHLCWKDFPDPGRQLRVGSQRFNKRPLEWKTADRSLRLCSLVSGGKCSRGNRGSDPE